jgi:hypothetical protein
MTYQQELHARYAAVKLRLNGPMRRQFLPLPIVVAPVEPPPPEPPPPQTTEAEKIVEAIRLSRALMTEAGGYKKARVIGRACAIAWGVKAEDLFSPSRLAKFVRPRQIAMTITRLMLGYPFAEIGRAFGRSDHTTALHAFEKFHAVVAPFVGEK